GVVALVLVLLTQATALAAVAVRPYGWLLVGLSVCGSRAALSISCRRGVPSARPDGLGTAVAGSVPLWAATTVWGLMAAALGAAGVLSNLVWWHPVVAAGLAATGVVLLTRTARRRVGGITGDVLGAAVEIAFAVLLVTLAVRPG